MSDERVIELCQLWWEKAQEDMQAALRLLDLPSVCCFHCQQMVEKAIKCLLVMNQIDFNKSHDIGMLLNLLESGQIKLGDFETKNLEILTRFSVNTRYPPESASLEEATEALNLARGFMVSVRKILPIEIK
jgi:HEPN domain-containing protein